MSRFRNSSAYKHAVGAFYKREQWYSDLRPCTSASDAQGLAASLNHIAFVLESGNAVGVIKEGNNAKREPYKIHAHSAQIYDVQFAPYNDNLLATAADDGRLRLWEIPETGLSADLSNSKIDLNGHRKRVAAVRFHPVADNILVSGGNDSKVLVWDIQVGAPAFNFDVEENLQGLSWNYDGSLIALTTSAKTVSVWDPRNQIRVQSGAGHQGVKTTRAVWLGASNYFATTGFGRSRERQVSIWDCRDLSKAVTTNTLDTSTGILEALYDNDTSLLYVGGKGDGNIRTYEIKDSSPYFTEIAPFVSDLPTKSLCLAPKRSVDVMNCEINRLYKLTSNAIAPISWTVPRKSKFNFAADLFPHTIGSVPAVSAVDWANGANVQPILIDLDPANFGLTVVQKEEIKIQEAEQKAAVEAAEKAKKNELPKLNIVRSSKYRHVAGKFAQRSQFFENVKADNTSSESESIKANKKYIAVPWSGAGGNVAILSLNKPIRVPDTPGLIECGSNQLDMDFHPFNDDILVTGLENAKIKIWKIPENLISQKQNFRTETSSLSGHYSKVTITQFHPVASNVLASASYDFTIKLWDIEKAAAVNSIGDPNDLTQCIAWNFDGSLLATANRDKKIRIVDPRGASVVAAADGHLGAKATKVTWMGNQNKLISVGFSRNSERQFSIWDSRNLVNPLGTVLIDTSSGVITPYYDEGTSILFTLGKGDATIPYYEIVDEAPYGHLLGKFQAPDPAVGVAVLPTRLCNVADVEFVSMLKLTTQRIQPLTFSVPRTRKEFFQDDVFPPARTGQSALSANDWFAGRNANPPLASLKPAGMINLSEAPTIEREKKYDFEEEQQKRKTGGVSKEQVMDSFFAKVSGDWKESDVVVPVGATYDHRNQEVDEDEWSD